MRGWQLAVPVFLAVQFLFVLVALVSAMLSAGPKVSISNNSVKS